MSELYKMSDRELTDRQEGNKWRFNANNYFEENGLDTSDMEMFRKEPTASLAREICQNSIDAKKKSEKHVEVVFDTFKVERDLIPGINRVKEEIESCIKYQTKKKIEKNVESLENMVKEISKEEITCLRISDYNTTGLTGIEKYIEGEGSFYKLTRTSGNSDKGNGSGGSKGIGKYATFVVSKFNTVFYSTVNEENQEGFLGISKLCSAVYDGNQKTEGTGYYGRNYASEPILGSQLKLTAEYERATTGTDIYILGFNDRETWKNEIVVKVLDSFMTALIKGELIVKIGEIILSKENLEYIVSNIEQYTSKSKEIKNIKSQYLLQTDETIIPEIIDMGQYGEAKLYIKAHSKEDSDYATQECIVVRYPYMKITSFKNIAHVPFSALCIIEDNKLNENLRSIENPQHTSWDIHELDNKPVKQDEVKNILKKFNNAVVERIQEFLSVSGNNESDIEGAGEYLPSCKGNNDIGNSESDKLITDIVTMVKPKKNKIKELIVNQEDDNGEGLTPDFINRDLDGEGSPFPTGTNSGTGNGPHDGNDESGYLFDGDQEGMVLSKLSGVQYRMIGLDKKIGKYLIIFTSKESADDCRLTFKIVDDSNNKERVNIKEAIVNGQRASIKDGRIINLNICANEKNKIEIITDYDGLYCGEVVVEYESR